MCCSFQLKALKRSDPDGFLSQLGISKLLMSSCFHNSWELSAQRVSWAWKGRELGIPGAAQLLVTHRD